MLKKSHIGLIGLITAVGIAGSAFGMGPTNVPVGGAVIGVNAGSGQIVIEVKNKTGQDAYDISISIFHENADVEVPNITGQDIVKNGGEGESDDVVDDNGDGDVDDDETDTTDSSPGKTCKSIMKNNGPVKNDEVAEVTVTFDGDLPEGAQIRVKFSKRIGDKHYDLCMVDPMDDGGFATALCSVGPPQMGYELLNAGSSPLDHLSIPVWSGPIPVVGVELGEPHSDRLIEMNGEWIEIFDLGLLPGEALNIGLILGQPLEYVHDEFEIPMFGQFGGCPGDFNRDGVVNTLDVLAFLNAWADGDPSADMNGDGVVNTLDVLTFLNYWSSGC